MPRVISLLDTWHVSLGHLEHALYLGHGALVQVADVEVEVVLLDREVAGLQDQLHHGVQDGGRHLGVVDGDLDGLQERILRTSHNCIIKAYF